MFGSPRPVRPVWKEFGFLRGRDEQHQAVLASEAGVCPILAARHRLCRVDSGHLVHSDPDPARAVSKLRQGVSFFRVRGLCLAFVSRVQRNDVAIFSGPDRDRDRSDMHGLWNGR